MKTEIYNNYQEIKKFVSERKLSFQGNSLLHKAILNNFEILQFIDCWLGKSSNITGGDRLTETLRRVGFKTSKKLVANDEQQWYQLLSELETFYFLTNNLGLDVIGYEQAPAGINKPPDFEINQGNEKIYFEVKFKASEVTQRVPSKFNDFLDKIEGAHGNKYRMTLMGTQNLENSKKTPNYLKLFSKYLLLPENLDLIEKKMEEHLNVLEHRKIMERKNKPSSHCHVSVKAGAKAIDIDFSITLKWANSSERLFGFRPDEIDDIGNWLFKEEESKTPMVKEAESKGAGYLVCFIPFWRNSNESFYDYITPLFSDIQMIKTNIAISRDINLRQLSGVILMSQKGSLTNNYVVVNNANVTPKIKDWFDIVLCR